MKFGERLPILSSREEIMLAVRDEKVVIISGLTGCGKSTQVPQFIINEDVSAKVVVCEPRRVAATSLAQRVSEERGGKVGKEVGHHIAMDVVIGADTRIVYMTYGVFINKLLFQECLPYTHIVLDEVHERSLEMDIIFIIIRQLLAENKITHLIIMSATINTHQFAAYFAHHPLTHAFFLPRITYEPTHPTPSYRRDYLGKETLRSKVMEPKFEQLPSEYVFAKTVVLPSFRRFKVDVYYSKNVFRLGQNMISDECYKEAKEIIMNGLLSGEKGDILVFVPGMAEIKSLKKLLLQSLSERNLCMEIVEVHSAYSRELFESLFVNRNQKIMLSTNIGESSITLPDCQTVIDFCLNRKTYVSAKTGVSKFETRLASKASLEQRAGRVGRVSNGVVYRLISEQDYCQLDDFDVPEIKCVSLEMVVLKLKHMELKHRIHLLADPYKALLWTIDPPEFQQITNALSHLIQEEALVFETQQPLSIHSAVLLQISPIGAFFLSLPCDISVSKFLRFGIALAITPCVITVAAIISSQKYFFVAEEKRIHPFAYVNHIVNYDRQRFNDYLLRHDIFIEWMQRFFTPSERSYKQNNSNDINYNSKTTNSLKYKLYIEKPKIKYVEKNSNLQQIVEQEKEKIREEEILESDDYYLEEEEANLEELQQFVQIKPTYEEFNWCKERGIHPYTMREILQIREIIMLKLKGVKGKDDFLTPVDNDLFLLCFTHAFPEINCDISFSQVKSIDSVHPTVENEKNGFEFECYDFFKNKLISFAEKNEEKIQIIKSLNQKNKIHCNNSFILKLALTSMQKKNETINYTEEENAFFDLKIKPFITNSISYKNMKAFIFRESINCICYSSEKNVEKYVLTHEIIKNPNLFLLTFSLLINKNQFEFMRLLTANAIKVHLHESKEFIDAYCIDENIYLCHIDEKTFIYLKEFRSFFEKKNKKIIFTQSERLEELLLKKTIELIKKPPKRLIDKEIEILFNRAHNLANVDTKKEEFIDFRECPLFQTKNNFMKSYKIWIEKILKNTINSYRELSFDETKLICKKCYPQEILEIDSFKLYNPKTHELEINFYFSNVVLKEPKALCLRGHFIGMIKSENSIEINHDDSVLVYIPNHKIKNLEQEYDEISLNEIEKEETEGCKEVMRLRKNLENFECSICEKEDQPEKINVNETGDWKRMKEHMMSRKHLNKINKLENELRLLRENICE